MCSIDGQLLRWPRLKDRCKPCICCAVNGEWHNTKCSRDIIDPMNGDAFINLPDPQIDEIQPYVQSLRSVPKSGLHNPLKNPER